MRYRRGLSCAALLLPLCVAAAEWTGEEQAFLEWEMSCWSDTGAGMVERCFHEDYSGWGNDYAVPYDKADRNTMFANERAKTDFELIHLKPLEIHVMDGTAVMLYVVTYEITDKRSGETSVVTEKWTDVAVRDGDDWQWIADHGEAID